MKIKFPFTRRSAPADTWTKCPRCENQLFNRQLERNDRVCPTCDYHFRLSAPERIALLLDSGSFEERDAGLVSGDPLGFTDSKPYPERIASSRTKSGLADAAIWGTGRIEGQPVALGLFDFRFMGGSMGSVVGEKVARTFEGALADRIPAIVVSASGGARMQEGTISLLQLAKTTAALGRLNEAGIPFISILTDPTTGGVLASFASLGDVILAEPGALIGFAGARVASGTVGEELPEGFQSAERLFEHGFVDAVVPRSQLRSTVARLVRVLPVATPIADDGPRGLRPIGRLQGLAQRVGGAVSETAGIDSEVPAR
jgi:acetyl-CoA carboxylase carboxyl transferase subunit beta